MKKFVLLLSTLLALGCEGLQSLSENKEAQSQIKPGMTVFEVAWILGKPERTQKGIDETYIIYGSKFYVFRNDKLSHIITATTPIYSLAGDALIGTKASGKRIFFSAKKSENEGDIYYNAYKEYLSQVFSLLNYQSVQSSQEADIVVLFDFDMNEQREQKIQSVSVPTTSYVWNQPQTTSFSSNTDIFGSSSGFLGSMRTSGTATSNGYGSLVMSSTERIFSKTEISYNRTLVLDAQNANAFRQHKKSPAWQVSIQSNGPSSDKRHLFAVLAVSALKFIGKNSGGQFTYLTAENDPLIDYVKGNKFALAHFQSFPATPLSGLEKDFSKKENVNLLGPAGDPPLLTAIHLGSPSAFKSLSSAEADFNGIDKNGKPLLAYAVERKDPMLVSILLNGGADPEFKFAPDAAYSTGGNLISVLEYSARYQNENVKNLLKAAIEKKKSQTPKEKKTTSL